jgi:competence protein ComEC
VTTPEAGEGEWVIGIKADELEATAVARTSPDASGGWAARLSTRIRARPSVGAVTASLIGEIDANRERWMLWAPVALGLGAAGYLELRAEPSWALLAGLTAGLAILATLAGRRLAQGAGLSVFLVLAAFLAAGALAGKVRSHAVAAPILASERAVMTIDGFVVDVVSPGAGGPRLLIAPVQISRLAPQDTPKRVRVTVEADDLPAPGQAIHLRAMLGPPPPPAAPGAYDFARDAWFHGVGGVGFAIGGAEPVALDPPPWRLRAAMAVNAFRWRLASRIVGDMGVARGGVAAAMVTGHEAGSPRTRPTPCGPRAWRTSCRSRACTWPSSAASRSAWCGC